MPCRFFWPSLEKDCAVEGGSWHHRQSTQTVGKKSACSAAQNQAGTRRKSYLPFHGERLAANPRFRAGWPKGFDGSKNPKSPFRSFSHLLRSYSARRQDSAWGKQL
ncbi:hypothetical protein TNCV_1586111 [Trichonephila clavipes]|uniref:Uncharacterized protein n=1 Tax=Trichonephila clavipes TaxID=2585209 RepID=A0A8X6S681_TRICX|nr:hypothetical protein TNCV_1586111 [Trichonephila clavipes]